MPALFSILSGALFTVAASYCVGRVCLRSTPLPFPAVFGIGAVLLSLFVYVSLLAGFARPAAFAMFGAAMIAASLLFRPKGKTRAGAGFENPFAGLDRTTGLLFTAIMGGYGVLYLIHALTPEIQPDGYGYHLGLVAEYRRLRAFPSRVAFYEMLPQGMEMLFLFAYAFGKHSAAKLVHLAFLAMTPPLMFAVARRLNLPVRTAAAAAVFYVCSPVTGVSGTSAYTDAALVFYVLLTFYLLAIWYFETGYQDLPGRETGIAGSARLLLLAGIAAGFCYAIKITGLMAAPLAALFAFAVTVIRRPVALRRHRSTLNGLRAALPVCAGAAAVIAPWMLRTLLATGNPFAPLFNRFFPNPFFHASMERDLAAVLTRYDGALSIPLALTLEGQSLQGLTGPLFLLAPLALLALRRKAGIVLLGAVALFSAPWFLNIGARFLMPSMAFTALALAAAVPRAAALTLMLFHAVTSWPHALDTYTPYHAWRLKGFPVEAALRLESDQSYLRRMLPAYNAAEMVNRQVPAGEEFLDLAGVPAAYLAPVPIGNWQSARGGRLQMAFSIAGSPERNRPLDLQGQWTARALRALRFRRTGAARTAWSVHEVSLHHGSMRVLTSGKWLLSASPNIWEAPLAFDRSPISRWTSWEPGRPGMYLEVEFGRPTVVSGATLTSMDGESPANVVIEGQGPDGRWQVLDGRPAVLRRTPANLRRSVARMLRREGLRYILVAAGGGSALGLLGSDVVHNHTDWGLERVDSWENFHLLRTVRQPFEE